MMIENRAREFAARYPDLGLQANGIAAAWEQYPAAAEIDTSVKVERISQISRVLTRVGVPQSDVVLLVAANPEPVVRPAEQFIMNYGQMASALDELKQPPSAFMHILRSRPELASMPIARMLFPLGHLSQMMAECGMKPEVLGYALLGQPILLPLLCDVSETRLYQMQKRIAVQNGFSDSKLSQTDRELLRRELRILMTHPESVIGKYLPEHGLVDPSRVMAVELIRQTEAVRGSLGEKAPSEAEVSALIQANPRRAIISALTPEQVSAHMQQAQGFFRAEDVSGQGYYLSKLVQNGYIPGQNGDVAADLAAVMQDARELKERLGITDTRSYVAKAAANPALREQGAAQSVANLEGLAGMLAPFGAELKSLRFAAARHHPLLTTTPESAEEHVREVVGYFNDPTFTREHYLKLLVGGKARDFRPLTAPKGQVTALFDGLKKELGADNKKLLGLVKSSLGITGRSWQDCEKRITDFSSSLSRLGVPREQVHDFVAADLGFFGRDTAKMGQRFLTLADHMGQYGMRPDALLRCATMKPVLLSCDPATLRSNVDPVYSYMKKAGMDQQLYTIVLKSRPELFLYKPERVIDNFVLIRESFADGYVQPSRQAKQLGSTPGEWALSASIALGYSSDQLALRRVWAREAKGGNAENYIKTGIAQVQGELREALGPTTDFAALARAEMAMLAQRVGHSFAAPVPEGEKKSWGSKKAAPTA